MADLSPWGAPVSASQSQLEDGVGKKSDLGQETGPPTTPLPVKESRQLTEPSPSSFFPPKNTLGPISIGSHPSGTPNPDLIQKLLLAQGGPEKLLKAVQRTRAERSLYEFVRQAWPSIDPSPFIDSWAIKALCEHLEAVTRGEIRFLLVNFPPRCAKTLVTSVCWPAWTWIQPKTKDNITSGPQVRILGASYGQDLSLKSSSKMRELIDSPWFQTNWGDSIRIKSGSDRKSAFENTSGGDRQATSITGRLLGFGGDIIIVDDPHNTEDVESDDARETILQGWRELSSTRLNDPKKSALVVIMQRLNEADVSGEILAGKTARDWVHLMIPMEHDTSRHCVTYLPTTNEKLWEDPRTYEGDLMWPERFGTEEVAALKISLGPYMASGRLQQSPSPKGGGIIKRVWWNLWPPADETEFWTYEDPSTGVTGLRYPDLTFEFASIDTAYTEKEENDYSACTCWGIFHDRRTGEPKVILTSAWRDRLPIHDLVQRILRTVSRRKLNAVLIENKASGLSVTQELKRLLRQGECSIYNFDPKKDGGGDKTARMYASQSAFSDGMIYAPDTRWAEMVISETEMAPKSQYMDLTDTCTQAIIWLRKTGLARLRFEYEQDTRPKIWTGSRPSSLHYEV